MAGKGSNVGKWIGIGCGGCLLLCLIAGVSGYFLIWKPAKEKLVKAGVNFTGDAKQIAGSIVMMGINQAKPQLLKALPAEDRTPVAEAITLLDTQVSNLKREDFEALGEAFGAYSRAVKANGGVPTPEAAQKMGDDLKRIAGRLKNG